MFLSLLSLPFSLLGLNWFDDPLDPYGSPDTKKVVDTSSINDPIRDGATKLSEWVGGINQGTYTNFDDAKNTLLANIQNITNWILWFLALIALITLVYEWIQMLINAKDSKKVEERMMSVKRVARALWWIGLSWVFISFVFYIIGLVTK